MKIKVDKKIPKHLYDEDSFLTKKEVVDDAIKFMINQMLDSMSALQIENFFNIKKEETKAGLNLSLHIEVGTKGKQVESLLSYFKHFHINRRQKYISGSQESFDNFTKDQMEAWVELHKMGWMRQLTF